MSRLLHRLDQAIAACEDPLEADCLRAERAAALARQGRVADARLQLRGVRSQAQRRRYPRLLAWTSLVSGQIAHFGSVKPEVSAISHFEAARQAAIEGADAPLQALAAAWLAAVRLNELDGPGMADALLEVQQLATPDDHAALARAHLVLANATRVAGLPEEDARRHEQIVHHHATADGDLGMIAAMMHNRASGQTEHLDGHAAFGELHGDDARRVLLEVDSGANLDQSLRTTAQAGLRLLLRARLQAVLQAWSPALDLLDQYLAQVPPRSARYQRGPLLALRAWCLLQLARVDEARADATKALALVETQPGADDRANTHARLAATLEGLGEVAAADEQRGKAYLALAEFRQTQAALARALARLQRPPG